MNVFCFHVSVSNRGVFCCIKEGYNMFGLNLEGTKEAFSKHCILTAYHLHMWVPDVNNAQLLKY